MARFDVHTRAAILLQKACRRHLVQQRVRPLLEARRRAAFRIQGLFRTRRARAEVNSLRKKRAALRSQAATVIASRCRGHLVRRRLMPVLQARRKATLRIQCLLRVKLACKKLMILRAKRAALQSRAATIMQRWCRGHLTRERVRPLLEASRRAARRIQGLLHVKRARRELQKLQLERATLKDRSATVLQRWSRGRLTRNRVKPLIKSRRRAAGRIRGLLLVKRARIELRRLRAERAALEERSAIVLERWSRGRLTRKRVRPLVEARRRAAFKIQGLLKVKRARIELRRLQAERAALEERSAIVLERWARGRLTRKRVLPLVAERRAAAFRIQGLRKVRRARSELRRLRAERAALEARSATLLQSRCRGCLTRKRILPQLQLRRQAAVRIQGILHIIRARKAALALRMERSAIKIQSIARGAAARRLALALRQDNAAVRIQGISKIRAARAEVKLRRKMRSSVQIQASWRRVLGRREARRRRADVVADLLTALCKGEVPMAPDGAASGTRTMTWLEKATAALDWKERTDQEGEEQQLVVQRRLALSRSSCCGEEVEGPEAAANAAARWAAAAAVDSGSCAHAPPHARHAPDAGGGCWCRVRRRDISRLARG